MIDVTSPSRTLAPSALTVCMTRLLSDASTGWEVGRVGQLSYCCSYVDDILYSYTCFEISGK
jgi:hypothetical protein